MKVLVVGGGGREHTIIKKIKEMLPGCIVMKNDPNYIQGIPDLLILYRDRWAALECKRKGDGCYGCYNKNCLRRKSNKAV